MTPTPLPPSTEVPDTPVAVGPMPEGGVGVVTWYLAACHRCAPGMAEPFLSESERDTWAVRHVESVGHTVALVNDEIASVVGGLAPTDLAPTAPPPRILSRYDDGIGYRTLCTGEGKFCRRWNGPYATPHLALASGRSHRCEAKP